MKMLTTQRWKFLCLTLCGLLVGNLLLAAPTMRVGSFMIHRLGADPEAEYERSLLSLANIIQEMNVDALAVQGVSNSDMGRQQVERLTEVLNRAGATNDTPAYQAIFAEAGEGPELPAFLVRSPVEVRHAPEPLFNADEAVDAEGRRLFRIMPQAVGLEADGFAFDLVSIHSTIYPFATDELQGRAAEYAAISDWLKERASSGGPAAVVAGVTNRHLRNNVWDRLQIPGHEDWYYFPVMEAIANEVPDFDPVADAAPSAEFNTVTNQNRRRIWDNIVLSRSAYDRFAEDPRWGEDAGLIAFDLKPEYLWVTGNHGYTIRMLSDHRPVWVELSLQNAFPRR